jgi:hypothetical protein
MTARGLRGIQANLGQPPAVSGVDSRFGGAIVDSCVQRRWPEHGECLRGD